MRGRATIGVITGWLCLRLSVREVASRYAAACRDQCESDQGQYHCNIPEQQSQCGNRHIGRARLEAAVDTHEHLTTQLLGAGPLR